MADIEVEESDLSAILATEIRMAQTFDQSKRTYAIEYMRGEMNDLQPRANGSKQTDRTLADNIAWTLPGVVRVFAASDQMVQFEAMQEGGEKGAEEASEYTNYSFFRENDGYRILYNATYDSLLFGNGAACSYWCPEETKTKLFKDKTEEELALLLEEGWQGMGVAPKMGKPQAGQVEDPLTGELLDVEVPTFTVRLQMVTERGQIRDMTLKPENLELSGTATTIEDARYVGYVHDDKTRSDLLEMADEYGWDKSVIEDLPSFRPVHSSEVGDARRRSIVAVEADASPVKSGDLLYPREVYIRADKDGDGVAELLRVWCVGEDGSTILSCDEWEDDVPFTDIPCYPVPHQWEAEGMYDRSADIMRVKTVLLRQLLDNTYAVAMPQREVEEGSVLNPEALVNQRFGGLLWKKRGSAPIIPHLIPFVGDKLMLSLTYMDEVNAKRTGISKTTMALDPEALQNQTATANQNQRDAGYSQIELIARNQAELGWTKFFHKRRNLAKKYIKETIKIPSRNGDVQEGQTEGGETSKYRSIQPEQWTDDMACTINVGLGTGSRDRDMSMLNLILNGQIGMADRLAQMGMAAKAIEFIPKIRKTAVEMAESSGLKNPDDYYPDFTDEEMKQAVEMANQPKPDPELVKEQAKGQVTLQVEQAKAQTTLQVEAGKNEIAARQAEMDSAVQVRREEAQLAADMQTKAADRESAIALETVKQQNENARFFAKLQQERELKILEMNAVEVEESSSETGEDGKPKGGTKTKRRIVDNQTQMMERLVSMLTSDVEIVRGPDGKATGTKRRLN